MVSSSSDVSKSVCDPGLFPPTTDYMKWSEDLAWQPVPVHTVPQAEDLLRVVVETVGQNCGKLGELGGELQPF